MADIKNTMENLERCVNDGNCILCPYDKHAACKHFLMRSAITAMKEQQKEIEDLKSKIQRYRYYGCVMPE